MRPHLPRFHHNNTLLYGIFIILIIHTLADTTCKLPEAGFRTPTHVF